MITLTLVCGWLFAQAVRRRYPAAFNVVQVTVRISLTVLALVLALIALTTSLVAGPAPRSGYR